MAATTEKTPPEATAAAIEYRVHVSDDKMQVLLDHPDPHQDLHATVDRILTDFEELDLAETPDGPQLAEILTNICPPGSPLFECPIIQGLPLVPPVHGRLEWAREFFGEGWEIDEDSGKVDFWQKQERRSVVEGELLVRLIHPVPGEPGLNVLGKDLAPDKPEKARLRCAKGVRQEEGEGETAIYAERAGRLRWSDDTVAVDDVYEIRSDVDLETGNVIHTGTVVIGGDIREGATVEADGDIVIKGMIETSNIRCGGSLTVSGGILGSDETSIDVAGGVQAKYISEAHLTAGGDIFVINEIAHSTIRTRGKVEAPRGRIAGGEVTALKGIQVKEAGASGSAKTLLVSGVDYRLDERLQPHRDKITALEEGLHKLTAFQTQAQQNPRAMNDEIRAKLAQVSQKAAQITQAIGVEQQAIESLTQQALGGAVLEVVMFEELWSGTTIQLGKYHLLVKASVRKPRIARLRKKKVRILPLGEGNMPDD